MEGLLSLQGWVGVRLDPPAEFGALHSPLLLPALLLPARREPCGVELGSREMRAPK